MAGHRLPSASVALLLALAASACSSRDDRAAAAAAIATADLQSGQLQAARFQIGRALAARDDISDYWLLSGRIGLAQQQYSVAYDAYESAVTLDHSNVEGLTRLCQLAVSSGQAGRAENYAEQLALLRPGDINAVNVKAALALERGDKPAAAALVDQVLKTSPNDASALITRARLLVADEDYARAAQAGEASLDGPGDPTGRLLLLKDVYLKSADAAGYRRTIARLARASPRSVPEQLDYARSLYETGDAAGGFAVTRRTLAIAPDDIAGADRVLHLWAAQGVGAMPADALTAPTGNLPLQARAAYASQANAIGRPDLALRILGDAAALDPPGTATNNVKVARAEARRRQGQPQVAATILAAVLANDPDQPRALVSRAALRAGSGDWGGATEDLRHALAADPDNADARLNLADLQLAHGDPVLAASTLRDGLTEAGADPRLASRLVAMLRQQGRPADAAAVIDGDRRLNPFRAHPPG
ncbi:tetratricopeptide repeat protein [Sphingomonas bacterium]|uniref:tetratricopeptide repeat protein n=1 Tax=Sphingomonas bacterium TaxID=1895847 RepID=UPI001575FAFD|nr:tetratricopeptide repeat protein [Sphingomonas bacterium]